MRTQKLRSKSLQISDPIYFHDSVLLEYVVAQVQSCEIDHVSFHFG